MHGPWAINKEMKRIIELHLLTPSLHKLVEMQVTSSMCDGMRATAKNLKINQDFLSEANGLKIPKHQSSLFLACFCLKRQMGLMGKHF